jgi:5'-nucleotidase
MQNIYIKNEKELNEKIEKIKKDGKYNLHIISDFDNTLSKAYINGEKTRSVIAQISKMGYLPDDYKKKHDELFAKYNPIEINPEIPLNEKYMAMEEWWSTHIKVLSSFGLSKDILDKTINYTPYFALRDKINDFFKILDDFDVPILIFSSGSTYSIKGYLKKQNCLYKNISIVSNEYEFDKNGNVLGYTNKIIHALNKGEVAIKDNPHFKNIKQRKNVILLGDSLEDLDMDKGIDHKVKITVGFYNDKNEKYLQKYIDSFDVVLCNDASMDYVNDLLKAILG